MQHTSSIPCNSRVTSNKRDSNIELCDDFCSATFAKSHCRFCKCKACSFCAAKFQHNATLSPRRGRELNAAWCTEALHRPTHIFRRMWAAPSWAPMEAGTPACWERRRDQPHRRLKPPLFFAQASNGSHCATNWYEGHAGALGEPGRLPRFAALAPALLGYDDGIYEHCAQHVAKSGAAGRSGGSACRRDRPGHVARCCLAAGFSILNMVGHRVPYNLCRNLEWVLCAVRGALPSQPDRSVRFANAPVSLEVEPLDTRRKSGCREPTTRKRGYSLPDIFHLEVCILHHVCTDGELLFRLGVGEPFVCAFSQSRFEELTRMLLSTPEVGGGEC